ncbi:hypothetical protein KP509_1Z320200 [Ceratopteris richardii]|nr:hypothetical protein KP509_1Z320200 [Ceratopteris richardii]
MHTLWLPHWVNEAIAYWQVVLSTGVSMLWKKVAYIAASTYKKLHDTKLSKNLDAVEVQVLSYMHRMKEILEERVHALWRSCNIFSRESVTAFEKALYQPHYFLQHPVVKLKQFFSNVLKYGISLHLELQRRVRTALQKNGFLAFAYSWEVVWFLASALLILPLCGLLLLSSFWG